jgi:hypothetical protein
MNTFITSCKKILTACFIVAFTCTALYVPHGNFQTVATVHADADDGANIQNLALSYWDSFTQTASMAYEKISAFLGMDEWFKETVLDGIAWSLAKAIVQEMQKSLIRWINSGFQGSPAFIQDLEGFLIEAADKAAGQFLAEIGDGAISFVCSPFRLDIQIAVANAYNRTRDRSMRRCTLTGALTNIQNFFGGDFTGGRGLDSWIQVVNQPDSYTYYGQMLRAVNAQDEAIAAEQQRRSTLAGWGQGFLSSEVCDPQLGPSGPRLRCAISTPGSVISRQINDTLGLSGDTLVTADEVNEVVGTLMQQLVVQTITGASGLLGMGGAKGYNAKYTNPSFNVEKPPAGSTSSSTDISTITKQLNDSIAIERDYLALIDRTIARYTSSYTTDPAVQGRMDAAYNEAVAERPVAKNNIDRSEELLGRIASTTDPVMQQNLVYEYLTLARTLNTRVDVDLRAQQWDFAFSGSQIRTADTIDRRTMTDALNLERAHVRTLRDIDSAFEALGAPSAAQRALYDEAQEELPEAQDRIIALQDIIDRYDSGERTEAEEAFGSLRSSLITETELSALEQEREQLFGSL